MDGYDIGACMRTWTSWMKHSCTANSKYSLRFAAAATVETRERSCVPSNRYVSPMPSNIIHGTKEEYAMCEWPSSENQRRMEHDVRKLVQCIKAFKRMHVNDDAVYTRIGDQNQHHQLWINMFFSMLVCALFYNDEWNSKANICSKSK